MEASPSVRVRHDAPDAGDALLTPVFLVALGLLLLNDHILKAAWPGLITGKLSDLAGLVFFPILLLSGGELFLALGGRWRGPTVRALAMAVIVSTAGFLLVKTAPPAAEAFGWTLGLAQWLLSLPMHVLFGLPVPPVARAAVVADLTDLAALPALALAIWVGASRLRTDGLAARPPASRPIR